MKRYELYGWEEKALADGAHELADALNGTVEPHESSYLGEYYKVQAVGIKKLTVQLNLVDEDGVLVEPEFPNYRTLVYATGASDENVGLIRRIAGLALLSSEEF